MSKIHPSENERQELLTTNQVVVENPPNPSPTMFTVWKRSSMSFLGTDGFTVFDQYGRLAFRVDNYSRKDWSVARGGLVLMDGSGDALLTLKPQVLSMQYQWNGYIGGDERATSLKSNKIFTMKKLPALCGCGNTSACQAHVFMGSKSNTTKHSTKKPDFNVEGSFKRRNCKIVSAHGEQLVAKIARKRVNTTLMLSDDVFLLLVQPGFEPYLVMAFLIIMDRICGKSYTPILCS